MFQRKNKLLKKLTSMKLFRRSGSKVSTLPSCRSDLGLKWEGGSEIEWELRPGGMLVQKRKVNCGEKEEAMVTLKVSNGSTCHDISIEATSTFGELKAMLSMVTSLEAKEQRQDPPPPRPGHQGQEAHQRRPKPEILPGHHRPPERHHCQLVIISQHGSLTKYTRI